MSITHPEICQLCSKEAKNKAGLSAHMRTAHKELKPVEPKPALRPPTELKPEVKPEAKPEEALESKPVNDIIWKLWGMITDGDERAVFLSYLNDTRSELEVLQDILDRIKNGDSRAIINQHIINLTNEVQS